MNTVNVGKYNLGWASIGMCTHAFYEAINHASGRVLYGNPVLRQKASEVSDLDDGFRQLLADLKKTMQEKDGLGLAANQVGLPVEGIALILGIDRILDMMRTACNVTGDCAVTCIIAKSEGALDEAVFNDPEAGLVPRVSGRLGEPAPERG